MRTAVPLAALLLAACDSAPNQAPAQFELPPTEYTNIADLGFVKVSDGGWTQHFAVDRDNDTWWSANDFAPQWLEVRLHTDMAVAKVELTIAQAGPGPATHKIMLENDEGNIVVLHRFDSHLASDGDTFTLNIDPPQLASKVRILTTRHEGWVAYRELRILSIRPVPIFRHSVLIEDGGLVRPVQLMHAGDGSGRLFVLEKAGRIRIIKDGALVEKPFLDISEQVVTEDEQGLLNIAFPPSYPNSRRFYVSYSNPSGDTVISRFTTTDDPDIADADSEEIILHIEQLGSHHNGGTIKFGPRDGYLYIGVGDGLATSDLSLVQHVQDPASLLGRILRIDVESGAVPYAIPSDNPFASTPGHAPEIWALGLRNPWGFAFDHKTGDLYIPDVGQWTQEEVSFRPFDSAGGRNYGWPCWEGEIRTGACELDGATMPVATYGRIEGCAVVGGATYEGAFIYADFCTGRIWALRRLGETEWSNVFLIDMKVPISSIGADEAGNVYAVGFGDGKIYKLEPIDR